MRIDVVTIFPQMVSDFAGWGILKRALESGILDLRCHDLRSFTGDRRGTVDDRPYGGGAGMVMKPEPFFDAVESILGGLEPGERGKVPVVLLSPQGRRFDQAVAAELAGKEQVVLLSARYEGVDERVRTELATDEISIGDYVLTGGELAAMVVAEAAMRLLPGALGDESSAKEDSFCEGLLEHPHYTRPPDYRGMQVPEGLLPGEHGAGKRWRRREALRRTLGRRPELLDESRLTKEERGLLREVKDDECGRTS